MTHLCPDCGAALDEDTSCQALFDSLLALEFSDPGYGEVHMLTVACFMIQHERYSDEALVWIEQKLRANLEEGIPASTIRRQVAKQTGQGQRAWKVTRQPGAPHLLKIPWSMTMADVASKYQDAASYQALVKQWARATVDEMKPFIS